MFTIKPVQSCPMTRKSLGIVLMTPELISELAAAVTDKDEWAILLTGERRKGGYEVEVTGYEIPPQERSGGHVSLPEFDLTPDIVGVIHSHHHMGAFFSDIDKPTLNTRFPTSIVIAHGADTYLGFKYLGTGKVQLPCGSTGEIEFKIQPTVGPVVASISQITHLDTDLGDCNRYVDHGDEWNVEFEAACGLKEPRTLKAKAFGTAPTLLDAVAQLARPTLTGLGKQNSSGSAFTQKQIENDPDSRFCKEHKQWDWCEYREKLSTKSSIPNDDTYWCMKHSDWDKCNAPKDESFLKKYENIVVRQSDLSNTGIDQLVYCDSCSTRAPFMDWSCENCGAPYCMTCEGGHYGECPDQEDGLCRCGSVILGNYTYCSQTCLKYYEPVNEVKEIPFPNCAVARMPSGHCLKQCSGEYDCVHKGEVIGSVEGEQQEDGSIIVVG